jgi:hypothetical protein
MKSVRLPPDAPVLLESMRAIGYEPATAVADLVDNSITAGARHVSVRFDPGQPRALAILDDGVGMDETELLTAMRHGSRSPSEVRAENDLGRFGLGLKTASLSQCRRLTVVSKKQGHVHGMVWDLDDVTVDWVAGVLESADLEVVPFIDELRALSCGTLVVWEKLDRLAAGDPGDGSVLSERMQQVGEHLSLVFHRYLSERPARLGIDLNLQQVVPLNPFLEGEGATVGEEERIFVEEHPIVLRTYTLPHISRLTRAQIEKAGGEIGLRRQQGFYVYRNRRLIVWGTWFRMFRQEELTKLTRVRVDVPNALDHLWSLDIKKSAASPPEIIRDRLKGLVPTMVRLSRQANEYRGRIMSLKEVRSIWSRIEDRDGVRYEVDWTHPLIAALRLTAGDSLLPDIDNVLKAVGDSLPVEALYNDRANDKIGHKSDNADHDAIPERLEELARQMLGAFTDRREERERLLAGLGTIEPFAMYPALVKTLQARLSTP